MTFPLYIHYLTGAILRDTLVKKKFKQGNHDILDKKDFRIEKYIMNIIFKNHS